MKASPAASCDLDAAAAAEQQAPAANKVVAGLRWAFVRKVDAILALQFALAAAFAATAWLVPRFFFAHGPRAAAWPTFAVALVFPLIVMFAILKRPGYLVLLPLFRLCCGLTIDVFTLCCCLSVAVSAFFFGTVDDDVSALFSTIDTVLLQSTILTVLGLTLVAFWAAKRGYEYIDTFSLMLTGLIVVLVYCIIEIPFPLVMAAVAICGLLVTLVFSTFVVIVLDGIGDGGDNGGCSGDDDDVPPA